MEVTFACARCADDYEEARRRRLIKEWRKRARRLRETVMDWMESIDVVLVDENKATSCGVGGDGASKVQPTVMSPVLMATAATTTVTGVGVLAGGG